MKLLEMTNEQYRAAEGVSSTTLKIFGTRSPYHAMDALKNPPEPTPAMVMGSAIHARILEPDTFTSLYACAPVCDRRTKEGKEIFAKFSEESKGKTVLTNEDYATVCLIGDRVLGDETMRRELSGGQAEGSAFWTDKNTGVKAKCRPDYYRHHDRVIIDVKTTENAAADEFARVMANLKYHWQAQHYIRGIEAVTEAPIFSFKFLVVEKKPPYAYALYTLHHSALDKAEEDLQHIMTKYQACQELNEWPSYPNTGELYLPTWALGNLE